MLRVLNYTSVHSTGIPPTILSSHFDDNPPTNHITRSIVCENCGHKHNITMNCGDRTCQYCREKSIRKSLGRKGLLKRRIEGLRFMTLTVKSVQKFDNEEILKVRDFFRHLIRLKGWKQYVHGGLYVIETTKTSKGYHIHLHILYSGKWYPWAQLQKCWKKVTSGSFIIWISKVKDSAQAMNYVLGYISKSEKSNVPHDELLKATKGVKLVQFFGTWCKMKVPKKPLKCEQCGDSCWVLDIMLSPKFWHDCAWDDIARSKPPPAYESSVDDWYVNGECLF